VRALKENQLHLQIELGRTRLPADDVRRLRKGSVVLLDARVDEPAVLRVGGRTIGRGEVVVIDGKIGVRVVELVQRQEAAA
jgi:flagellar motor switch protein FliN